MVDVLRNVSYRMACRMIGTAIVQSINNRDESFFESFLKKNSSWISQDLVDSFSNAPKAQKVYMIVKQIDGVPNIPLDLIERAENWKRDVLGEYYGIN